jgi:hypothetical protein
VSLLDLQAVQVWPGVRRAGLQRLSGGLHHDAWRTCPLRHPN